MKTNDERALAALRCAPTCEGTDAEIVAKLRAWLNGPAREALSNAMAPAPTTTRGRWLTSQPDSSDEAVFYSHFDCWPGGEDSTYSEKIDAEARALGADDWTHPAAVKLAAELVEQARRLGAVGIAGLGDAYLTLGQLEFFRRLGAGLVAAGFAVYDGDGFFEAYPGDIRTEDDEEEMEG